MGLIASLKTWIDNEILTATDLNASFAEIRNTVNTFGAFKDLPNTFTQANTFSQGVTIANGATVTGGATITGAVGITGAASVSAGLTVSGGGAAITGNSSVTGTFGATGAATFGSTVTGASFTGAGTGLTAIPTGQLTAAALPSGVVNATNIPASRLTAGTAQGAITAPGLASSVGFTMTGGSAVQTPRTATISTSTHTIDCSTGNWFERTVQTSTTISFSNFAVGQEIRVLVQQSNVGGQTVTFSGVQWAAGTGAPALTATANRWDTFLFVKRSDGTVLGYIGEQNHL